MHFHHRNKSHALLHKRHTVNIYRAIRGIFSTQNIKTSTRRRFDACVRAMFQKLDFGPHIFDYLISNHLLAVRLFNAGYQMIKIAMSS